MKTRKQLSQEVFDLLMMASVPGALISKERYSTGSMEAFTMQCLLDETLSTVSNRWFGKVSWKVGDRVVFRRPGKKDERGFVSEVGTRHVTVKLGSGISSFYKSGILNRPAPEVLPGYIVLE
jgi:hypothetical protein